MPGRLEGKVAIITGGGSGFGKAMAERFTQEGAKVLIAELSQENGTKVAKDLNATFVHANVTDRSHWQTILDTAVKSYGTVDIVVNNAGACYSNKPTETVTDDDYDITMNVNVRAIYLSTSVILPWLLSKDKPAVFISIASTAGKRPRPGLTWYNASKAAVINASNTMAVEYGPKKIRFNTICPVLGSTGMYVSVNF